MAQLVQINIASVSCNICGKALTKCKGFADTPVRFGYGARAGAWGYVCTDTCEAHITPRVATFFDVAGAIGTKRQIQNIATA